MSKRKGEGKHNGKATSKCLLPHLAKVTGLPIRCSLGVWRVPRVLIFR